MVKHTALKNMQEAVRMAPQVEVVIFDRAAGTYEAPSVVVDTATLSLAQQSEILPSDAMIYRAGALSAQFGAATTGAWRLHPVGGYMVLSNLRTMGMSANRPYVENRHIAPWHREEHCQQIALLFKLEEWKKNPAALTQFARRQIRDLQSTPITDQGAISLSDHRPLHRNPSQDTLDPTLRGALDLVENGFPVSFGIAQDDGTDAAMTSLITLLAHMSPERASTLQAAVNWMAPVNGCDIQIYSEREEMPANLDALAMLLPLAQSGTASSAKLCAHAADVFALDATQRFSIEQFFIGSDDFLLPQSALGDAQVIAAIDTLIAAHMTAPTLQQNLRKILLPALRNFMAVNGTLSLATWRQISRSRRLARMIGAAMLQGTPGDYDILARNIVTLSARNTPNEMMDRLCESMAFGTDWTRTQWRYLLQRSDLADATMGTLRYTA